MTPKTYKYSLHTGEIIETEAVAEWIGETDKVPPAYDNQVEGCFFKAGAWVLVASAPDVVKLAEEARALRNSLIAQSDWTVLADAPLSAAQKTAWAAYRQSLRDVTAQAGFPVDVVWPVKP